MLVTVAISEAERLNRLIRDLLDVARFASTGARIPTGPVSLEEVMSAAVSKVDSAGRIDMTVAAGMPPVRADSRLLEQALINLLENAIKYSPAGSAVRISAQREGRHATVVVSDDGPGIPTEERTRVFESFFRGQRCADVPGSGLGLAICKGFIEAMGGAIVAGDDGRNMGASFRIRLSLCADRR